MPEVERISVLPPRPNADCSVEIGGTLITLQEMRTETGREVGKRRRAYPNFIRDGRLSQTQATEQINRMDAAYYFLKAVEEGQFKPKIATIDDLFGDVTVPLLKISALADQLEAESRDGDAAAFGKNESAKAIRQLIKEAVG